MERIVNYSYRGILKSCNYNCAYCPFAKISSTPETIQADRDALFRFCHYIESLHTLPQSLQIFLLPYGEGMIHKHYTEALARLSQLPTIRRISCQTNLSWNIDQFAKTIKTYGGTLSRLSFWCSFHPQCTSLSDFISQCSKLDQYRIHYCAGMVAKPGYESVAREMRNALPHHIYMWLNSMDGLKRPYTVEENACFEAIDPFFALNQKGLISDIADCKGGKDSLFIQADGRVTACPIARRYLGNIYNNHLAKSPTSCKVSHCNCYLAYSNRTLSGLEIFFGRSAFFRIPERIRIKNLFLDIDGTLTNAKGDLYPNIEKTLTTLTHSARLYFATELPYLHAYQKCNTLFPLFSGGIFAGGAHIRLFNPLRNYYFYIPQALITQIDSILMKFSVPKHAIKKYSTSQGIYRIAITGNRSQELSQQLSTISGILLQTEKGLMTLLSKDTDKGKALIYLLQQAPPFPSSDSSDSANSPDFSVAIGNDISDINMFRVVKYPLSIPGSPQEVKQASIGTMPVTLLPVFFGI